MGYQKPQTKKQQCMYHEKDGLPEDTDEETTMHVPRERWETRNSDEGTHNSGLTVRNRGDQKTQTKAHQWTYREEEGRPDEETTMHVP